MPTNFRFIVFLFLGYLFSCSSSENINNDLVMVSYSPGLEELLKDDPKYLGKKDKHLLLKSPSLAELEWLSLQSHTPGTMCGTLQYRKQLVQRLSNENLLLPSYSPYHALSAVNDMIATVDYTKALATVETLVAQKTRFHKEATGQETTTIIRQKLEGLKKSLTIEINEVDHSDYLAGIEQKSLVVRIPGDSEDTVIIGAHLDSIFKNRLEPDQSIAPGADDDGSGVATIIEMFRVIADRNLNFNRSIEFHFYAAEEIGLIGSGDIAQRYAKEKRNIATMIQFDMTGYSPDGSSKTIYFPDNDTSINLRRFAKEIMNTYLDGDYGEGTIVGGTSDHASFSQEGFEALFPFEHPVDFNKNLHTKDDTLATMNNPEQMGQFASFGLAYVAHFAGLKSAKDDHDEKIKSESPLNKSDDLYVAIVSVEDSGYQFSVSAPSEVSFAEVCLTSGANSTGCSKHLIELEFAGEKDGRKYYSGFWSDLTPESFVRIIGYDSNDKWVYARNILVSQK